MTRKKLDETARWARARAAALEELAALRTMVEARYATAPGTADPARLATETQALDALATALAALRGGPGLVDG